MKKRIIASVCAVILIFMMVACESGTHGNTDSQTVNADSESAVMTSENTGSVTTSENTGSITTSENTEEPFTENEIAKLGTADNSYLCGDSSRLNSYEEKTYEDFDRICRYLVYDGYDEYCSSERNGSAFATYIKGSKLASIYWLKERGELNIVMSSTAGKNLPPATPGVTDGRFETTVVQLQQTEKVNGMGYIIRLADGSFIIYDGGYANMTEPLYNKLVELSGGENIVIRAWVLTHSHADHYPAFAGFAASYADKVSLEYVLTAPVAYGDAENKYLNGSVYDDIAKFSGAKSCIVHTGMTFTFCNLKMEILFSPEELYIDAKQNNFNNSSIVSRLYSDGYSMLFMGDAAKETAAFLTETYGTYLQSNMCQVSHHGVEDVPLSFYTTVKANILWYPCSRSLYNLTDRNGDVRRALERASYTEEILIQSEACYQRSWGG